MIKKIKKIITRVVLKFLDINLLRFVVLHDIKKPSESHNNLIIESSSTLQNFQINVRNDADEKIFMQIGNNCLIQGNYIFENENGFIKIGDRTFIGGGTFICIDGIEIGSDVMFAWGCTVMDNDAHSLNWGFRKNDVSEWIKGLEENTLGKYKNWEHVEKSKIIIQDKAWIGFNSIILKGVTIGEGAVVAAGSVVTKNVEPYTLVAGNPAKFIKNLPKE